MTGAQPHECSISDKLVLRQKLTTLTPVCIFELKSRCVCWFLYQSLTVGLFRSEVSGRRKGLYSSLLRLLFVCGLHFSVRFFFFFRYTMVIIIPMSVHPPAEPPRHPNRTTWHFVRWTAERFCGRVEE